MSAARELMAAVQAALAGHADLAGLVGGRIYDRVPDRPAFPYLTYGGLRSRALDGEGLTEHALTLSAWSRGRGRGEAQAIVAAVAAALAEPPDIAGDHRLVSLRAVAAASEGGRDEVESATITLRAVTEPLGPIA